MVVVMLGDASRPLGLSLLLLKLVLVVVCPLPQPGRPHYYVPDDFSAPLELPQSQFGLIDDYGVLPKHPVALRPLPNQAQAQVQAQQKRDESDISQNYYDNPL
ncbi:uncharacterized protein C11orf94 homolog [Tachyglossus aculeatus]|uniref:uncharacterized protein C11orf94 homolog n=1 Tax=Tachyglossus aculeatus TaxID=9261 RepID=UPI0018F65968|nr:uncharacterized protein C11orf94 homolog [Tachyglossus aculeatus]